MQKIISLFQRNYEGDRRVRDEVTPGAEWVIAGEGVATRKWDGTCCMIKEGILYKRYDAKNGKTPPAGFVAAQEPDPVTGHWPGWVKCDPANKEDKWHWEAIGTWLDSKDGHLPPDGTYELVGPKINGNKDKYPAHALAPHGKSEHEKAPRTFNGLRLYFAEYDIEGLVWHHPDGRMVKIKKKDFGYKW